MTTTSNTITFSFTSTELTFTDSNKNSNSISITPPYTTPDITIITGPTDSANSIDVLIKIVNNGNIELFISPCTYTLQNDVVNVSCPTKTPIPNTNNGYSVNINANNLKINGTTYSFTYASYFYLDPSTTTSYYDNLSFYLENQQLDIIDTGSLIQTSSTKWTINGSQTEPKSKSPTNSSTIVTTNSDASCSFTNDPVFYEYVMFGLVTLCDGAYTNFIANDPKKYTTNQADTINVGCSLLSYGFLNEQVSV